VKSALSRRTLLLGAGVATLGAGCERISEGLDHLYAGVDGNLSERFEKRVFRAGSRARQEPERARTRDEDFPAYFLGDAPPLAPASWRLEVGGMVRQALFLSPDDLQRLPRTDLRVRHYCVEGWSAVADWHGVRLVELARIAGMDPRAAYVEFETFDRDADGNPYRTSWDLESALHPQTIIAYGMNGGPLTAAHGAPVRLYAGVKLGYKLAKYLSAIRFTPAPTGGYWEDLGYEWFAGI